MTQHAPLVGVYPGTFDPITHGHTDIIHRATKVVDRMVVGVAENAGKSPLFSVQERVELVRREMESLDTNGADVEVHAFDNLLIHFVQEVGARVILRGLRAVSDFEYEFQMACMNTRMDPSVETVFLTASERQQFLSARFVKEIAALDGDISSFVSPNVAQAVLDRFQATTARESFAGRTARD